MQCPSCHADHSGTGRFCTQCGAAVAARCAACGALNSPDSRYCGQCGERLDGVQSAEPAAPYASAGNERRHLTVLFCDIVESTALAKRLDPEDLNDVTRAYYDCCTRAIEQFDGIVANFIGDGVMALFGYPRAHEDDPERAVHAALTIIGLVEASPATARARVQVRVGIATGHVVVGVDGAHALTKEKTIVGETPNFAAHLTAAAEPGTVLIAAATRRLVGNIFALRETTLERFKGTERPVTAWRVLHRMPTPSRFAAHVSSLTGFVGRDQEVSLLTDRWHQAGERESQVVLLAGEAGIGKSRIVESFRERIQASVHTAAQLQCSPHHMDSALYPVIAHFERVAQLAADDSAAKKIDKLERLLGRSTDRLPEVAPLIASLLSIPAGERYAPSDPDPQRRKERTLQALIEQFANLARAAPLLMILEDAHWADPTTLELIGRMILQLRDARFLLIVTYRPEFKVPWTGHPHVTAVQLNRLARRHCQAMVVSIASGKPLPAEVMEQIIAKTDGVPLFVEELTKNVLESGLLSERSNAWQLNAALPPLAIPATLHDSLTARFDRMSSVKEVAQIGATIGREFPYDLLAAICPLPEAQLQEALVRLAAAELIFARGDPPNASYVFKHALVQDAAYETLLKSKRQRLHGEIAQVLETRFTEVADARPEIVAHHYTQAGAADKAVEWWHKSGELAIRYSANSEAVRHLRHALELLQLAPPSRTRGAEELAIRIKLSGPLIATSGYVSAELADNYARAWALCTELGEDQSAFPVMYGQWVIPYVRGDMAAALTNSERFLRRAERQDDDAILMMGHRIYGASLVWRGDTLPGSEHLQRALSLYRGSEHDHLAYMFSQHPRVAALAHLCLALQHLGRLDQAMAAGRDAIDQAKRFEHFNSIAYALCFVGLMIMLRRDIDTLRQMASELLQLAERHNAAYWAVWAHAMLGWIEARDGKVEAGIRRMHRTAQQLGQQKANLWVPQILLLEAEILGEAREYRRAYRLLDDAQALIEPLDQRFYEAELHRVRGAILLAEHPDRPAAGAAELDRALEVARRQHSRFLELRAAATKARLCPDGGEREQALELLARIHDEFTEGAETTDLREARALLEASDRR